MLLWYVKIGCVEFPGHKAVFESHCSHFVGLQQKQAEQEEEFIVNKLMKRLDQLKREKQVLANEVCNWTSPTMNRSHVLSLYIATMLLFRTCPTVCRSSKKKSI